MSHMFPMLGHSRASLSIVGLAFAGGEPSGVPECRWGCRGQAAGRGAGRGSYAGGRACQLSGCSQPLRAASTCRCELHRRAQPVECTTRATSVLRQYAGSQLVAGKDVEEVLICGNYCCQNGVTGLKGIGVATAVNETE